MGMTVREMLARMGSDELTDWIAFYDLEPWGEERRLADYRAGVIAATIMNLFRGKGKSAIKPENVITYKKREKQQDWRGMRDQLMAVFGGKK